MKQLLSIAFLFLIVGCKHYYKETENVAQGQYLSPKPNYTIWIWDQWNDKILKSYECPLDAPDYIKDSLNRDADKFVESLYKYTK